MFCAPAVVEGDCVGEPSGGFGLGDRLLNGPLYHDWGARIFLAKGATNPASASVVAVHLIGPCE